MKRSTLPPALLGLAIGAVAILVSLAPAQQAQDLNKRYTVSKTFISMRGDPQTEVLAILKQPALIDELPDDFQERAAPVTGR